MIVRNPFYDQSVSDHSVQVTDHSLTENQAPVVMEDKEQFIRQVLKEDPKQGCELLFRNYYKPLCSHAARLVYSKQLAEDIVGEVFYLFWSKQLYLHITASYRAYLFTAVRHNAITYLRSELSKEKHVVNIADVELQSLGVLPDQPLQYDELYLTLEKTIQSFSPSIQQVFLLSRYEGKKNPVIAEELQISIKTVEAHLTKALKLLRKALQVERRWFSFLLVFIPFF